MPGRLRRASVHPLRRKYFVLYFQQETKKRPATLRKIFQWQQGRCPWPRRGRPPGPERQRGSAPDPGGGNDSPRAPSFLSAFSQRSSGPPFFFPRLLNAQAGGSSFFSFSRLSTLGGPGPLSSGPADARKQAEFTSGVKRGGRRASPASVQRVQGRRAFASLGRRRKFRRARLRPPAVADRCSRFAVTSVLLEGISRCWGECVGSKLWEAFVERKQTF